MSKKTYKIVATATYRDRTSTYVVVSGLTKREANEYLKTRCYTTVSRTFHIEEE